MFKVLGFTIKVLLLLVIVSVAVVLFAGGGVAKYMINFHSERLTGVKMSVAGAELSILNGQLTLNNLAIANPNGYEAQNAATIESVRVSLQPKSVLNSNVLVDFVGISGLRAFFEGDNKNNNFTALQKQVDAKVAELTAKAEELAAKADGITKVIVGEKTAAKEPAAATTFLIRQLEIRDTAVSFRPQGALAKVIQEPVVRGLDDIILTDIGTADGGKSGAEILDVILAPLFKNLQDEVLKVFSNPEGLLKNLQQNVQDKVGSFLDKLF